MKQESPELLLPAGNVESFHAAVEGGADAIFLGLKQFNARGRAKNFLPSQLNSMLTIARSRGVKIYITLNTVVKNTELPELLDYLHFLSQSKVDGIIIQDWGVYYLARKYFPNLVLHSSTQMGIHNSLGVNHAAHKGIKRVVLARELTLGELKKISKVSEAETEVFVHGALCYSFSGMCLYSSYAGGRGANRGLCTQPCRREYTTQKKQKYLFNLKDNQLIDYINTLGRYKVDSLKIEGRMKSGEYTYRVAKAYRMVLDGGNPEEAKKMLALDFGREKTSYFMGKDVKNALSGSTVSGVYLGKVKHVEGADVLFSSQMPVEEGFRLRFHIPGGAKQETLKVRSVIREGNLFKVHAGEKVIKKGSLVYLSGVNDVSFPSKMQESSKRHPQLKYSLKKRFLAELKSSSAGRKQEIIFRINSMQWLRKVNLNDLDGLILSFTRAGWNAFDPRLPFIQKFKEKIYIEFPKFIQEESLPYYKKLVETLSRAGLNRFMISHISQKDLLMPKSKVYANENVYVFNDAVVSALRSDGVQSFTYPQEIDFETLFSLSNKGGIVPVYFHPELFYSRMPIDLKENGDLTDDSQMKIRRFRRNGITCIVPEIPVAIFQSVNKLKKNGFSRFLIDLSYEHPSKNRFNTLRSRLLRSEQIQPSNTFNFVKGLK